MTWFHRGLLMAIALGLSACAKKTQENPQVFETVSWSPEAVQIQCPSGDCPDGVGLVTFVQRLTDRSKIGRCTASLISANQILTNAHCLRLLDYYDEAYFFVRHNGQMVFRSLINVDAVGEAQPKKLGRDYALLSLSEPIDQIRPQKIAREIPAELPTVVAFSINGVDSDQTRMKYTLDKKLCETEPHVGLLNLGYADRGVALALFSCSVIQGNSGSPVFAPDDFSTIHLLVTSTYSRNEIRKFFDGRDPFAQVYWETPRFQKADFPAAERLHCLELPGQPQPRQSCLESVDRPLSFDVTAQLHKVSQAWILKRNRKDGLMWEFKAEPLRPIEGTLKGLILTPVPVCRIQGADLLPKVSDVVEHHRIGLNQLGLLENRIEKETPIEIEVPKNLPVCPMGILNKLKGRSERALINAYEDGAS